MASSIMNNFNSMFNDFFEALSPMNVCDVKIPKLKIKDVEEFDENDIEENIEKVEEVVEADDKITCPVKIKSAVKRIAKVDVMGQPKVEEVKAEKSVEKDEVIDSICTDLDNIGIKFTNVNKMPTGLTQMDLLLNDGTFCTISVDGESKIYNDGVRIFFLGKINPGDEYTNTAYVFAAEPIRAIVNGVKIPDNFYVPEKSQIINRMVDMRTLKKDKKRNKILSKAAKAFEKLNDEIQTAANGEPFRFAFTKIQSEDHFSMVSSKRNVESNLSDNKLVTTKEIWIDVDKNNVTLHTK